MTEAEPRELCAAILLSTDSFEDFFGREFGLTPDEYVRAYRNDWAWDWTAMLRSAGIRPAIYVASLEADGPHETGDGVLVRFLRLGAPYEPWKRLPVLKRSPPGRYLSQLANAQALIPGLERALAADGVDVLLVQEYWTGRWDRLAGRLDVPLVAVDQGLPPGREIKALKRRSLPRARLAITQTEAAAELVRRYGGRAERIPNGVDTELFAPGQRAPDTHTVLTVARLHDRQKRLSDLLRAVAELGEPWRLRVAGTGPDRESLQALAAELGVADRVEWIGFVGDKARLSEHYAGAGIFALPSAWEGLPVALLEAMSCGAVPVGSDIPAIAEVVEHGQNGLLVPVGRPERLAQAIAAAQDERERLGAAARRTVVERYSRSASAERLAQAVRRAAAA
jgi:glycosyltransferase involved in cell wall biosynthesis